MHQLLDGSCSLSLAVLTRSVYVKLRRKEKSLTDPEACLGTLSIPMNAENFDKFKQKMDVTLSIQS